MSSQLGAISSINNLIGKLFTQPKGDFAGRLNSRITVAILGISAGLLLTTHFWGDPITCWIPAEFPKIWADFVDQYCFVHGTYWAPLVEPLDFDKNTRQRVFINYYQWIPYVLAAQAICFYIPRFVWRMLSQFSGYDLPSSIQYVDHLWHQIRATNFKNRTDTFEQQAAPFLWDGIRLSRRRNRGQLALYFLLYTFIQSIVSTSMFLWLNQMIESPIYSWGGPSILLDLINGLDWQETGHFPRITHCDFTKRKPASVQVETVMCVLTLNIYYEKLLIFLWFWMLFVCGASWLSFLNWAKVFCFPHTSRQHLQACLMLHSGSSAYIERFMRELGNDGVFILHQISLNIGELPASYLILAMYNLLEGGGESEARHLLEKSVKSV
ncbi:hypothetical protein niasHS_012185 [Heterodera schachtii]|uniref:Innexin n=1 Tax=Heterodera schachtii TaxID=97005 RepID=A0ABD2IAW3_HETSC